MQLPKRIKLAHLPTPIHEIKNMNDILEDKKLYFKRDDFTGLEYSGNKVRKMEYILADALTQGADVLITCGGVQSNHCRATASLAASNGLKAHLLLKGEPSESVGNSFLNHMFGANCEFITQEAYSADRQIIMEEIKNKYLSQGKKAYIIPEGASDGLGMFGYYTAMLEIVEQEKALGFQFDTICVATGSAGTYAGLYLANQVLGLEKHVLGINIYDKNKDFHKIIKDLIHDGMQIINSKNALNEIDYSNIDIDNRFVDGGYGVSSPEEIGFIKNFAEQSGILLDPVYTGKAMYGLKEIMKSEQIKRGNVLFIHTGGQFGAFARKADWDK